MCELTDVDVQDCIGVCRETLQGAVDRDWTRKAGDLEWDCRRTLDHIADVLALYAGYLASRARGRLPVLRDGDPDLPVADLLTVVGAWADVFAAIVRDAPPGTRAFHPAGLADVTGYVAMACEEILGHTYDICQGLGLDFRPPDDLSRRILWRLFPWAPTEGDCWANLLWATGRVALPDRERLGPDWYWHCAPLEEWDGTIRRRTAPPAWR